MVCDGAAIPANPGVNPSLTITALAEHAMAQVPAEGDEAPPVARAAPQADPACAPSRMLAVLRRQDPRA